MANIDTARNIGRSGLGLQRTRGQWHPRGVPVPYTALAATIFFYGMEELNRVALGIGVLGLLLFALFFALYGSRLYVAARSLEPAAA
jgi:hypothetical protein